MKKYKRYFVGGLVILGLTPVLYLTFLFIAEQVTLNYINRQLGTDTRDWLELYQAFETHFQPGMHRDEVIDILLELDPTLEDDLQSEEGLRKSRFGCWTNSRGKDRCAEQIVPFQKIIPVVGSTARFDYSFAYDQDMHLVAVSGPASPEDFN
ncbi:MAG: hypothetical protein ACE5E7_15980 [Anaerolineae bacterium]